MKTTNIVIGNNKLPSLHSKLVSDYYCFFTLPKITSSNEQIMNNKKTTCSFAYSVTMKEKHFMKQVTQLSQDICDH